MERPEFWGIYPWLRASFHLAAAVSLFIFSIGFYSKLKAWSLGSRGDEGVIKNPTMPGLLWLSLKTLFTSGCLFANRSLRVSGGRAVFLLAVEWSFIVLFMGTVLSFLNFHLVHGFLSGRVYHIYKAALDWAGMVFILCILYAIFRRAASKRLPSTGYDYFLLSLMLLTALTAFAAQGIRFNMGPWPDSSYSPAGVLFTHLLSGVPPGSYAAWYNAAWAMHVLFALVFIAYIPYSRIFHVFAAQITTYAANVRETESNIRWVRK